MAVPVPEPLPWVLLSPGGLWFTVHSEAALNQLADAQMPKVNVNFCFQKAGSEIKFLYYIFARNRPKFENFPRRRPTMRGRRRAAATFCCVLYVAPSGRWATERTSTTVFVD